MLTHISSSIPTSSSVIKQKMAQKTDPINFLPGLDRVRYVTYASSKHCFAAYITVARQQNDTFKYQENLYHLDYIHFCSSLCQDFVIVCCYVCVLYP